MKIFTRVVMSIATGLVLAADSCDYNGPVALCAGAGGGNGPAGVPGSADAEAGFGSSFGGTANDPGSNFGAAAMGPPAPTAAGDQGQGGQQSNDFYGSLTTTQQAIAKGVAMSMMSGNIPLAAIGILGLALSGAGKGDVGTMGGGPGVDQKGNLGMRMASNPQVEQTGLTGQPVTSATGQPTAQKNRGRSSTLMTGPLGLVDNAALERKTLMQRGLRSTLG